MSSADAQEKKYSCSVQGCGATGTADQMWTLDKRATGGRRVVVCAPCGRIARRQKIRTYRLSETLRREQELAARKGFFRPFAEAFAKARAKAEERKSPRR